MTSSVFAQEKKVETIVFIRHGEKPKEEIGQINCQGLNRSLKLKKALTTKFGTPNFIFAPNPSKKVEKLGKSHYYIRPLATIEPTAIELNLPVNTEYGYQEVSGVSNELLDTKYENSLIFIAWEHKKLVDIAQEIYSRAEGKKMEIPQWDSADFDSIYILKITTDEKNKKTAVFSQDKQGLNELSPVCP